MSSREKFISAIAGIMRDRVHGTGGLITIEEAVVDAKAVNNADGFVLELRDADQDENHWSQYSDAYLDDTEINEAIELARQWLA